MTSRPVGTQASNTLTYSRHHLPPTCCTAGASSCWKSQFRCKLRSIALLMCRLAACAELNRMWRGWRVGGEGRGYGSRSQSSPNSLQCSCWPWWTRCWCWRMGSCGRHPWAGWPGNASAATLTVMRTQRTASGEEGPQCLTSLAQGPAEWGPGVEGQREERQALCNPRETVARGDFWDI